MKSDRNQLLSIPVSSDLDNCYATHTHVHTHRHIQTCTHAEDLPPLLRSCRLPTLTLVYLNSESVNRLSHYLCPLLPQHILLSTTSCCIWRFSHSLCHTRTSRGGKQNKNKPRAPPPPPSPWGASRPTLHPNISDMVLLVHATLQWHNMWLTSASRSRAGGAS